MERAYRVHGHGGSLASGVLPGARAPGFLSRRRRRIPTHVCGKTRDKDWQGPQRTDRDRKLIDDLMAGERTMDVAGKHGLSAARVSQLRREFRDDWESYCE